MKFLQTRRSLVPAAAMVAAAGVAGPTPAYAGPSSTSSTSGTDDASGARNERAALSESSFERRLVSRTNTRRAAVGCAPVRVHSALQRAAKLHSTRMGNRRVLSHRLSGEPGLATRITNAGYRHWRLLAENIAWSTAISPDRVFKAWIRSPGHRRNIQDCRLREIGIGVQYTRGEVWATQDFGRR